MSPSSFAIFPPLVLIFSGRTEIFFWNQTSQYFLTMWRLLKCLGRHTCVMKTEGRLTKQSMQAEKTQGKPRKLCQFTLAQTESWNMRWRCLTNIYHKSLNSWEIPDIWSLSSSNLHKYACWSDLGWSSVCLSRRVLLPQSARASVQGLKARTYFCCTWQRAPMP